MTAKAKLVIKFHADSVKAVEEFGEHVQLFFHKLHQKYPGAEVVSNCVERIQDGYAYQENFYSMCLTVSYHVSKRDPSGDLYTAEVCRSWSEQNEIISCSWLQPLRWEHFYYEESRFDRHMKTNSFSFGTLPFMAKFVEHYCFREAFAKSEIVSSFFHSQKYFVVYFSLQHVAGCDQNPITYNFKVPYSSFSKIIVHSSKENPTDMYFLLDHPPLLYCLANIQKVSFKPDFISRASDVEYNPEKWERTIVFGCTCNYTVCSIERIGKCNVLKLTMSDKYRVRHVIHRLAECCKRKLNIYYCNVKTVQIPKLLPKFENFPCKSCCVSNRFCDDAAKRTHVMVDVFKCQYAWATLLCHSYFVHDQVFLARMKNSKVLNCLKSKLLEFCHKNPDALSQTLLTISDMVKKNMPFNFFLALDKLFLAFCVSNRTADLPVGMCLVRRAIITPSKMILLPPAEHFDNRIIRQFGEEFILRISVQDDNFSKLTFAIQYHLRRKDFVEKIVGTVLTHGITIGNRQYEVLASSNSQLREHGLWLYAEDLVGYTSSSIRQWMGDFSHIRNVAKYMARMGQCFSTSNQAVQLAVDDADEICLPDVTRESSSNEETYIFSDGVGTISPELADEVNAVLSKRLVEKPNKSYKPSAFQIRYKGCKGMVAVNPAIQGKKLGIRPSMKKFECKNSSHLEIVKVSAPRRLFLNRPLISIFDQLGVPQSVFLRLQQEMILHLIQALIDEREARQLIRSYTCITVPYIDLANSGISVVNEPFFRTILLCIFRALAENLHRKMRIAIPPDYGRNMLGIMDETGSLQYGQVFVQYSESIAPYKQSNLIILKGTVVVTKNPCMHPGDVRKLEAVDIPALRHVKDCIVFPSQGKRPHPNEMAGSDLDGDEYAVMWYPDLIFHRENYPAMHYPSYRENKVPGVIGVNEMIEFFCNYIMNDNIGIFANAHLSWADQHPKGIFSDVCMNIARKYPFVLDFAKTGKTQSLKQSERPKQYPDFMKKGNMSDSYCSQRVLGLMYRMSRYFEACADKISGVPSNWCCDAFLEYPGWEKYRPIAEVHRTAYCTEVQNILNKFGIRSEAEALSGCVKGQLYNQSRQEKDTAIAIAKEFLITLMHKYRCIFIEELNDELNQMPELERTVIKYQRASAWYMVTYQDRSCHLLSFPWVLSDILAEVRMKCLDLRNGEAVENVQDEVFKDLEVEVNKHVSREKEKLTRDGICICTSGGKFLLKKWFFYMRFTANAPSEGCLHCFERVFANFLSATKMSCSGTAVKSSCSPLKICVSFLKFFCNETDGNIGSCQNDCCGFLSAHLQALAVQTLTNIAITRNINYLCINSSQDSSGELAYDGSMFDVEGEIVRVPVRSQEAKKFVASYMFEIKEFLKKQTGVTKIFIEPEQDIRDNCYLLVSSEGRDWQRWHLECFVLDPYLFQNLERALKK